MDKCGDPVNGEHVNNDGEVKRRRIHMTESECINYTNSTQGGAALVNPNSVPKSSHNPNCGLYPRLRRQKLNDCPAPGGINGSFVTAKAMTGALPCSSGAAPAESNCSNTQSSFYHSRQRTPTKNVTRAIATPLAGTSPAGTSPAPTPPAFTPRAPMPRAAMPPATAPRQTVSPVNTPPSSQEGKRTPSKMFSPVKCVEGTAIFTVDDRPEQLRQLSQTNKAIKQLFVASQSSLLPKPGSTKPKEGEQTTAERCGASEGWDQGAGQGGDEGWDQGGDSFDMGMSDTELLACEDPYGLLGSGNCPQDPNYFHLLPDDIVEEIFCYLPIVDLCLSVNRVCVVWNRIISNPKFLPWKKLYFRLTRGDEDAVRTINRLMQSNSMKDKRRFLPGLVRYMVNHHPRTSQAMRRELEKHPKYSWADSLMTERFTDCFHHGDPNLWCVLTVLVIVSDCVGDITAVLSTLLSPLSQCSTCVIMDALYCVAAFLLAFTRRVRKEIWNGMHYRLYYALYLFENSSVASVEPDVLRGSQGQQTISSFSKTSLSLTHEQLRICNYNIKPRETIKIVAFAGTGKTSTLVRYTQLRPHKRFLLVVYNKAMQWHSERTFPANVTCKTGHSLAYKVTGHRYKGAGKLNYTPKVQHVVDILPHRKGESLFVRAKQVLETVKSYLASADRDISLDHTPTMRMDDHGNRIPISLEHRQGYVSDAVYLWKKMADLNNKVQLTHDGYLKLYQLQRPLLPDFDVILIDEAQDLTPAVADILLSQPQAKILVGDPHQQIYSFRGATNAMQQVTATHVFYLTQSFRFGPEIARVAACCLELLKSENKKILVGNGKSGSVLGEQDGQLAIIARTNFGLFNEAVKKCCYSQTDYKVFFVGGMDGFGFKTILQIYALMLSPDERKKQGFELTDNYLKRFDNIGALEKYATQTMDVELTGKIRIVRSHHHNLPACISTIQKKCIRDQAMADIIFTTAHKAKGLEFSTVKLTDDFFVAPVYLENLAALNILPMLRSDSGDESNLLYVAVTRARKALQMSPSLHSMLRIAGERFEYPMSSKDLKAKGEKIQCRKTDAEFSPLALTLRKKDVCLSDGVKLEGGVMSPEMVKQNKSSWSGLLGPLPNQPSNASSEPHGQGDLP